MEGLIEIEVKFDSLLTKGRYGDLDEINLECRLEACFFTRIPNINLPRWIFFLT